LRSVALAAALFALASSASADSVIHDARGDVERWHRDVVTLVYANGAQPPGFEQLDTALRSATDAWNAVGHTPRLEAARGDPGAPGFDTAAGATNTSGVYVSTDGLPGLQGDALAVTLVTTNADTGEILDTDVVFNARDHVFAALGPDGVLGTASAPYDLQNTLTHELGHVLGLGEDPGHPLATMYPTSMPGEVQKRTLDAEDVASVGSAYAADLAPPTNAPALDPAQPAGGCGGARIAPRGRIDDTAWILAAFALGAAALLARRQRSRIGALVLTASCLVGAASEPQSLQSNEARVISRTSRWEGHVIHTHAVARDAAGSEHVIDALGGRVGPYVMHVYGASDGADLEPGATISLSRPR
jgi:hypothetical protein